MSDHASPLSPEELRERLRPFCEKYGIRRLDVFGSAASGQASSTSDVDLLVTLADAASFSTAELFLVMNVRFYVDPDTASSS